MNFVFTGFNDVSLCQVAANTMLNICQKCQQHMVSHLDTLLNIVVSADAVNVPSDASIGLLKGLFSIQGLRLVGKIITCISRQCCDSMQFAV